MTLPPSVSAKLARSDEHLDRFVAEVAEINAVQPYGITSQRNADKTELSLHLAINQPLPLQRWALLVGDCVHNLRSALDHMIYSIAIKASGLNPPPDAEKLMFPIVRPPSQFKDHV